MLKKFFCIFIVLLSITSVMAFSAIQIKEPAVIKVTWNAKTSDAIGIYGGNFVNEKEETSLFLGLLSDYNGQTEPDMKMLKLSILNLSDDIIQSEIPLIMPCDAYFGFVKVGNSCSKPFFINVAELDWISEAEICTGQKVRVFGRNLLNPKTESSVGASLTLKEVGGESEFIADIIEATDYTIDFTVPEGLSPGKSYILKYNNGAAISGTAALLEDEAVKCLSNSKFEALKNAYGVQLGWADELSISTVYNVKSYNLKGDGSLEDGERFEAMLKNINKDGGIIYFPEGVYNFTRISGFTIPDRFIIAGGGNDKSIIKTEKRIHSSANYSGMANIGIVSELVRPSDNTQRLISGYTGGLLYADGDNVHFFAKGIKMSVADGSSVVSYKNRHVVIEDSAFDITHQGPMFHANSPYYKMKVKFYNSYIKNTQRSMIWHDGYTWVENCHFEGANGGDSCEKDPETGKVVAMEHRISEMNGDKVFFGNNLITGTIGDQREGYDDNSGEGICNQASYIINLGAASYCSENTLVDMDSNFDIIKSGLDSVAGDKGKNIVGAKIAIISGKGLGQIRRVTGVSGNTVTIDRQWDVIPENGSDYTIDAAIPERYIIVNNMIEAKIRKAGIMLYNKSYDNIIDNNTLTNSGGIWFGKAQVHDTDRNAIAYFNYTANNKLSGGVPQKPGGARDNALSIGPGDDGGVITNTDNVRPTTSQYANIYKNNLIEGNGNDILAKNDNNFIYIKGNGINVSTTDLYGTNYPFSKGIIVEKNTVTNSLNGVMTSPLSHYTLLYKNNFYDNEVDYNDYFSTGTVRVGSDDIIIRSKSPFYSIENKKVYNTEGIRLFDCALTEVNGRKYMYVSASAGLLVCDVTDENNPFIIQTADSLYSAYLNKTTVKNGYLFYVFYPSEQGTVKAVKIFNINNDGTISENNPHLTIIGSVKYFDISDDLMLIGLDNKKGLDIYSLKNLEKIGSLVNTQQIRTAKAERLDDNSYRIYYITQTAYSEEISGITYTCDETFYITDVNLSSKEVTGRFSGKPSGEIWPGYGEFINLKGIALNWGDITIISENIIQFNTTNADFKNYSLVINAVNPAMPVIFAAYENKSAIVQMIPIEKGIFTALSADGGIQLFDYKNPFSRVEENYRGFSAYNKRTCGYDVLGNDIYVVHDSVFSINRLLKNSDLYAEDIVIEKKYSNIGDINFSFKICNKNEKTDIILYCVTYDGNGSINSIVSYEEAAEKGDTVIKKTFSPSLNDKYLRLFLWSDSMRPLNEACLIN